MSMEEIKKYYKELDKKSDESVNNFLKNMRAEKVSTNKYYSQFAPVDEIATMGSDTGIVRDYTKMPSDIKNKWDSEIMKLSQKEKAAETILKERSYTPYYTKKTEKNPVSKIAYKSKLLGKTLKSVAPILGALGVLGSSDAAQAAADVVVPGGVESMGVSPEQAELDRRYVERIRELSKRK